MAISEMKSMAEPILLWLMDSTRPYQDAKSCTSPQTLCQKDSFKFCSGCVTFGLTPRSSKSTGETLIIENVEIIHMKDDTDVLIQFYILEEALLEIEDWELNLFGYKYCTIEVTMKRADGVEALTGIICQPIMSSMFNCSCRKKSVHISGRLCAFSDLEKLTQQQSYLIIGYDDFVTDGNGVSIAGPGTPYYQYLLDAVVSVTFSMKGKGSTEANIEAICHNTLNTAGQIILSQGYHSDFIMKVDGRLLPCHKCILAGRSEVLGAMIESDFFEGQSQEWITADMTFEAAQCFLKFLYCNDVDAISQNSAIALELLKAGHKYMIKSMELVCKEILLNLKPELYTPTVAFELFAFAGHVEGLSCLQTQMMQYFKTNTAAFAKSGKLTTLIEDDSEVAAMLFGMVVDDLETLQISDINIKNIYKSVKTLYPL